MKITKNGIVLSLAAIIFVTGLAAMALRSVEQTSYDEPAHRAAITEIFPSVRWLEYREAARDVCGLDDQPFRLVEAMAADKGVQELRAFLINTSYLCPERLKLLEK